MSAGSFAEQLDEATALPGSPALDGVRHAALERFNELGLPNRRVETFRYTDLTSFADRGFRLVPPVPDHRAAKLAGALVSGLELDPGRTRLVFIDGHFDSQLSAIDRDDAVNIVASVPPLAASASDPALVALNSAFAIGGASIQVNGNSTTPIEMICIGTGQLLAPQVRLSLTLAADAEATVIQRFFDLPQAEGTWINLVVDVEQQARSRLRFYRFQAQRTGSSHTALLRARLGDNAHIETAGIELGASLVRNELEISLDGEGARAEARGFAQTNQSQHCDTRIFIDHRAAHTESLQEYRAIVADTSRSVFNGKVTVREHAQHIVAHQRNDNLLLSEKAEADTKPELEIYADQVICSHGATVGDLDEDHLFYLRSRGIDADAARTILASGFADTILAQIALDDLRETARQAVTGKLSEQLDGENNG